MYKYVYINMYMNVYMNICAYVCVCLYICHHRNGRTFNGRDWCYSPNEGAYI